MKMWAKRPTWPSSFLLNLAILAQSMAQTGEEVESPRSVESGSTSTPLFLRPGSSYQGKTASTRIANTISNVAVLVAIDNWTRFKLILPQTDIECGKLTTRLPKEIVPGTSEMTLFEKGPGFTGVCVVQTYQLELPETENPTYIQIMMSVPYNLNSYNAYLAVGVDSMYLNSTGLFDQLYYYTGPFERALAGNLVEFTPDGGKVMVRGTMTPDTYKPIFRVSVLPIDKKADGFQMYSSQNCLHWSASGKSTFLSALCLTLIFTLSNKCLLM